MFTAALARSIPESRLVWFFSVAALVCLPAAVGSGVLLAFAEHAAQAHVLALMCAAGIMGSLVHASIVLAVMSRKNIFFWVGDFLAVVSLAVTFSVMVA